MGRAPCERDSRRARRLRAGVGLLAGCALLAGCVSVRPQALAPPDRVAQTSLVLDAGGRAMAALHGPQDRTAVPLAEAGRWMRLAVVDTEDAASGATTGWTGRPWPGRRPGTWSGARWSRAARPSPSST